MKKLLLAIILLFSFPALCERTNDPFPIPPLLQQQIGNYGNSNPGDHMLKFVKATYNAGLLSGVTSGPGAPIAFNGVSNVTYNLKVWLPKNAFILKTFTEQVVPATYSSHGCLDNQGFPFCGIPILSFSCGQPNNLVNLMSIQTGRTTFVDGVQGNQLYQPTGTPGFAFGGGASTFSQLIPADCQIGASIGSVPLSTGKYNIYIEYMKGSDYSNQLNGF